MRGSARGSGVRVRIAVGAAAGRGVRGVESALVVLGRLLGRSEVECDG
jgi:hypothetical protein